MRNSREMFKLIEDFAREHNSIRAVYLNGSRTNRHVIKDCYQDYDVVYVVNDYEEFRLDTRWLTYFGDLAIKQEPCALDQLLTKNPLPEDYYMFLVLFSDGNRIDFKFLNKKYVNSHIEEDKLVKVLLDKEGLLAKIPKEASDSDYWVKAPSQEAFTVCCNDFWWCLQNVGKGLKRGELTYAFEMYESVIRPRLNELLDWQIGLEHHYQVSVGKSGKFYPSLLSAGDWQAYLLTYSDSQVTNFWLSLWQMVSLFQTKSRLLSQQFGFKASLTDEQGMITYLKKIEEQTC